MAERILIVEDEQTLCESMQRVFLREGYEVDAVNSAESAIEIQERTYYDLIISDIILPGMDGIELLRKTKERYSDRVVIIITAYASLETAVEALRAGAYDYVVKPVIHEEIKQIVRNALKQQALEAENTRLRKHIEKDYDFSSIIGESLSMKRIVNEVKKIADAKSNVLVLGETGTGKELIARAIHFNSKRADKPFIPINCSAIPENLIESELFGHVKGAFTGAVATKKGLFEEASGGTVFLDEIGDLNVGVQSKLLRVLQDQEIRPVGGTRSIKVDNRFIFATNKNIENELKEGRFREDLFYRINVITIKLPPLKDRREDVELLAMHFIKKYSTELGKPEKTIDRDALDILLNYNWPGNIRELQNIIERAVLISESALITSEHLPEAMREGEMPAHDVFQNMLSIEDYTKAFIMKNQAGYTEQQLADMLGITRKSLWEKRKKWGITRGSDKT